MAKDAEQLENAAANVAVIGAGLSGLVAARRLQDRGCKVTVFEKSRGLGGRMATRRLDAGLSFDHGAQYFTARDKKFREQVESWREGGLVALWPAEDQKIVVLKDGHFESEKEAPQRFVGTPTMNAFCKNLATGLQVHKQTKITRIERTKTGYQCSSDNDEKFTGFSHVIVSAPAEQTLELIRGLCSIEDQVAKIAMNPCWSGMYSFEARVSPDWVGAFVHDSFLSWAAQNSTKPGRKSVYETLVLHANPEWTRNNWERDGGEVAADMLSEFWKASKLEPQIPTDSIGHRWKFAIAKEPATEKCFVDQDAGIIACGDWANGSRVEGAFLSGLAAADRLMEFL